jgi:hypothetical protein
MQKVVMGVVLQPKLWPTPDPEAHERGEEQWPEDADEATGRVPGRIYVNDVDIDDQAFILQFVVGGTRDLAAFRRERAQLLVNLSDGEAVAVPAE